MQNITQSKVFINRFILTKRYRDDADLDINILFDVPESEREYVRNALRKNLKDVNAINTIQNTQSIIL